MNFRWTEAALPAIAFLATVLGTRAFQAYAISSGIIANRNFRSLHQHPTPRAGGIVFSFVFICGVLALWAAGTVDTDFMRVIVAGGMVASLSGFADDRLEIGMKTKLAIQAGLAVWVLMSSGGRPLADFPWTPAFIDLALSWLALVWLMNVYNFMDGIDGMAASGSVFLGGGVIVALLLTDADSGLVVACSLLAICSAGFLMFNWPPASIFMGESGSLCLGYCFCVLLTRTVTDGEISIWTWVILFGYFAGDTTTTTVLRMFVTRHWYGEHRSHAYQNLARIWDSHSRVVRGVSLYHVLWLLPLAVWSVLMPATAPLAAALALGPVVVLTLRYGPMLSSS